MAAKRCDFLRLRHMLLKSHLQALVLGLVRSDISGHEQEADHPNGVLYFHEIQEHAIFSILYNLQPAIRMVSPSLHSTKTLRAAPAKNRLCRLSAWQTPPNCRRFHDNLYRFISGAAPLCTNLDGNLCPTLTAHSEPLPFSELAETGSRQIIHISIRVLG